MANALSAMMTSFALTTGAPAPVPFVLPPEFELRRSSFDLDQGGGTIARGISISKNALGAGSASEGVSITSAARDHAAAELRAAAVESRRASYRAVSVAVMRCLRLAPGWDGDGGVSPQLSTVVNALSYLREVELSSCARAPRVFVVGDGEIGFSWESPSGYAQIGFHDDDEIVVIARSADGRRDIRDEYKSLAKLPRAALREILGSFP